MYKCMYFLLSGFLLICAGNSMKASESIYIELEQLYKIVEEQKHLSIEQWSVIGRETTSIESEGQFLQEVEQLKEELPDFEWTISYNSTNLTALGVRKGDGFKESVSVASTLTDHTDSYISYEIVGSHMDDKLLQNVTKNINKREKALFQGNTTFFTCIKGHINDNIDKVLTINIENLMKDFQAVEVESVQEENFVSMTANSSLFKQSFVSEQYNLQIAMRNDGMGSTTSFVIGTPIITFEY